MLAQDPYALKAVEYLLGLGFLVFFALFWRYALARPQDAAARRVPRRATPPLWDMFRVPDGVMFHPGHAWARLEAPDLVTVGIDDFAQHLVGPIDRLTLPPVGSALEQGSRAWRLAAGTGSVDMLSPVTGRVAAINPRAIAEPRAVNDDPFGEGWLIKVHAPRLVTNGKQLLSGAAARRWTEGSWEDLSSLLTPELGTIMHDGGMPVHGLARGMDEERWPEIARRFLLT